MSPLAFISGGCGRLPILVSTKPTIAKSAKRFSTSFASLASPQSPPPQPKPKSNATSSNTPFVVVDSSPKTPQDSLNYALASPNGTIHDMQVARSTESDIEKVCFLFSRIRRI